MAHCSLLERVFQHLFQEVLARANTCLRRCWHSVCQHLSQEVLAHLFGVCFNSSVSTPVLPPKVNETASPEPLSCPVMDHVKAFNWSQAKEKRLTLLGYGLSLLSILILISSKPRSSRGQRQDSRKRPANVKGEQYASIFLLMRNSGCEVTIKLKYDSCQHYFRG